MPDFENKIIKIFLNETSGSIMETGMFIEDTKDFLVIKNTLTNRIQYVSKFFIKYVEIVRSADEEAKLRGEDND